MLLPICECGREVKPGEDQCFHCLGEADPAKWEFNSNAERWEYIQSRESDFSRIGSDDWKEEMRKLWPFGGSIFVRS